MEKFIRFITSIGVLWFAVMLIVFPKECIESGMKGLFLCFDTIIPSLFPFFVCSGIIAGLGLVKPLEKVMSFFMQSFFGVSGKGALPFIMGILSGYPVGAVCVADLYSKGECTKSECEKMLAFCNNTGPLFILGAVGAGMLGSSNLGRWLYIIHILSAILTGFIFRFVKTSKNTVRELCNSQKADVINVITDSFAKAAENMISVCGFVIFFYIFGSALRKIGITPIFHGFLEISGGAEEISNLPIPFELRLSLLSGIIAFSGFSVILQVLKIVKKANLSPKFYIAGKIVQCIIAFLLTNLLIKVVPLTKTTSTIIQEFKTENLYGNSISVCLLIFLIMLLLRKYSKKIKG